MNKRLICLVCLIAATAPARAYDLAGYKWEQASTTFYVGIPGTAPSGSAWNDAFVSAAAAWNSRTVFDFNVFPGSADPCAVPTGTGDRNGVMFGADKCGSTFGATTLAVTRNWSVGDTLVQSGIVFNDADITWDVYHGPWLGTGRADFRRVAVHELGHALGLSHSPGGIMSSYAGNTTWPAADDVAGVSAIYGATPPPPEPPPEEEPPPPEDDDPPPPPPEDENPPPPPEDEPPPPPPEDENPPPGPPAPRPDEIFAGGFEARDAVAGKRLLAGKAGTLVSYDAGNHRIVLHTAGGDKRYVLVTGQGRVVPVKGDFDGDGVLDVGTFRAIDGLWTLYPGDGGPYWRYRLGGPGDVPAPADFDGDGETDLAVWSPADQTWRIKPSSLTQTLQVGLGKAASDVPAPGDYTGDGRSDLGIWSPSEASWLVLDLHSGVGKTYRLPAESVGRLKVAPGDYDGDGRVDPALFDSTTGIWTVRASGEDVTLMQQFPRAAGALALPTDYDADGKTDPAWWREGVLHIQSSTGSRIRTLPLPGTAPVRANMPAVDTTRTARWHR